MNYEGFKQHVNRLTGMDLASYKENQMKRRIEALIKKNGCRGYDDFLLRLQKDEQLLEAFKTYVTINVTEFYRNPSQWEVLESHILPLLLKKKSHIKIWSAACSTGDEPYSLAMILLRLMPISSIQILATDIDKEVLRKAEQGFYTERHLSNLPERYKHQYMVPVQGGYQMKPEIRRCITFRHHDLLKDPYPKDVDLIICRNVLIYFTDEAKKKIYHQFKESLTDDGILFVGSTEQILMCQEYGMTPCKTFFYQKIK